jgi:hypothetical protein
MPDILISNERWKAFSNLLLAFCGGLLAASAARIWERQTLDGASVAWLLAGLVFGFVAWRVLGFLAPEGEA